LLTLTLCLAFSVRAQTPGATYSPEQLDQLLGPIALYPRSLGGRDLPASTVPSDITLAANYLAANGPAAESTPSRGIRVSRLLARYPDIVKWMNRQSRLDAQGSLGAAVYAAAGRRHEVRSELRFRRGRPDSGLNTREQQL